MAVEEEALLKGRASWSSQRKDNIYPHPPYPYHAQQVEEEALLQGGEPCGLLNRKVTSTPHSPYLALAAEEEALL